MIVNVFKNLQKSKIYKIIKWFFSSPIYILFIAFIALYSEIEGRLDVALYIYPIFGVIIPTIFFDDLRALIAPLFFGYIAISKLNNDSRNGISLFNDSLIKNLIITFGIIVGACLLIRIIFDLIVKKDQRKFPRYIVSIALMLVSFTFGGVGTTYFKSNTILFGASVGLFLLVPYLVLIVTVDFKTLSIDYFGWLLTIFGLTLAIELFFIFKEIGFDSITTDSSFRNSIYTGWGINNNIGGELCIALSASAYLSIKKKYGFLFLPIMFIDLFSIVLTTSRTSILVGMILFISTITIIFILSNKIKRVVNAITLLILSILYIFVFFKFKDNLEPIIVYILNSFAQGDLNDISSNRLEIYRKGIEQFKSNILTGVGFFNLEDTCGYLQTGFMPFRYHNTIIQLLASTGIIGLIVYLIHRGSFFVNLFRKPNLEKLFITLAILGLTLTSLLDCHFFNLGPTMEYSILIALYEGIDVYDKNKTELEIV